LYVAGTPVSRAVRAGLAILMATPKVGASLFRVVAPRYVVIATAAEDDSPAVGIPMARGHERAIVVTSGYDQASRAVVLPFAQNGTVPRFAVKVASTPKTAVGTLRENERLISLHSMLPSHTASALPKPMGVYSLTGRTACVQSCAPGPSMSATVGRWGRPLSAKVRDLDAVVDWFTELALATRVGVALVERDWTLIYQDAAAITEDTPGVARLLTESQKIAKSTALGQYAVHQHYDAGPWNVHIDGAEPMLIDWETDDLRPADCLGPPLADLLYLLTYWYFLTSSTASESEEEAAIVRLFATVAPADDAVVAARGAIDRALVALGLERRVVPAALAALWAERALYTHRRRAILGVPTEAGQTRPEAFLRALAGAMQPMSETYDW
jgi:hypothetical protein